MQKFEETGSVADRTKSGRRSLSDERTDAVKEAVREIGAINEWGVSSVRSISQSTGIPRASVHSILKKKYHTKNIDYQCATNCNQPITKSGRNSLHSFKNLDNVLWTDEGYFHLYGTVYTKNAFI